jgi:hypothetical protein
MKKSILIILTSILLSYPMNLIGADFETPHEFKAGDTISAEMMNEIFEYIKKSKTQLTYDDLVGTWNCDKFIFGNSYSSTVDAYTNYNGWYVREGVITTFTKNNDGTMSWSSSNYNSFIIGSSADSDHCNGSGTVALFKNLVGLTVNQCSGSPINRIHTINKLSKNLYNWTAHDVTCDNSVCLTCSRQNVAPNPPSTLTYANSSSSITLTWTDNQTEAVTGYKVIRKTVVTDNFTTVSTITDNTTRTYADTDVSDNGSYWYRVRAYNSNGDGTPSKVVKSEFP